MDLDVCGCFGVLILVGSAFYLWDGLWHGFGDTTLFALVVLALGAISLVGWWGRKKQAP